MERVAEVEKKLSLIQMELINPSSVLLRASLQNPLSPEALYFRSQCERVMVIRQNLENSSRCYLDQQQMITKVLKEHAQLANLNAQSPEQVSKNGEKSPPKVASMEKLPEEELLANAGMPMTNLIERMGSNIPMTASIPPSPWGTTREGIHIPSGEIVNASGLQDHVFSQTQLAGANGGAAPIENAFDYDSVYAAIRAMEVQPDGSSYVKAFSSKPDEDCSPEGGSSDDVDPHEEFAAVLDRMQRESEAEDTAMQPSDFITPSPPYRVHPGLSKMNNFQ
jgi:hypothetical protein